MAMLEMANIFKQILSHATAGVSWQPWDQGTLWKLVMADLKTKEELKYLPDKVNTKTCMSMTKWSEHELTQTAGMMRHCQLLQYLTTNKLTTLAVTAAMGPNVWWLKGQAARCIYTDVYPKILWQYRDHEYTRSLFTTWVSPTQQSDGINVGNFKRNY